MAGSGPGYQTWYERYNVSQPHTDNEFSYVPDHVTDLWPAPNYTNPDSRQWLPRTMEPLTMALGILLVALRLFSRFRASNRLYAEDWVIVASMIFCCLKSVTVLVSTTVGFGLHRWDIPSEDLTILNKYYLVGIVLYLASVLLTKTSIILRYRRMFPPEVTHIRRTSHIIVFGFFAVFVATFTVMINTCNPIPSMWRPDMAGKCINVKALFVANVAANCLVDFAIYLLPLPYLWKLNLPKRQKVNLLILFGLGFSVCCMALGELAVATQLHNDGYFDFMWRGQTLWALTALELFLAITAASLPDIKVLATMFFPRFKHSWGSSDPNHDPEQGGPRDSVPIDPMIVNPAAVAPELVSPNRNSKRISKPYWLRSQLDGSLFSISTSRRNSAAPSTGGESDQGKADADKEREGGGGAVKADEKRVTMIAEEDYSFSVGRSIDDSNPAKSSRALSLHDDEIGPMEKG